MEAQDLPPDIEQIPPPEDTYEPPSLTDLNSDAGKKTQKRPPEKQPWPKNPNLPTIEIHDRELREKRDRMISAIVAANEPPRLFHGDSGLIHVGRDKDGIPILRKADRDVVVDVMADAANWTRTTTKSIRVSPPRDLAENYMAQPHWPGLPPLDGVVTAPIFGADGTLCDTPGYNLSSRLFLSLPPGFCLPDTTPTPANFMGARELIEKTIFGEVAFSDHASRAHAIALMILPFVRQMITGPTPLHLFDAPAQSSGKSYAASLCIQPFCTPTASVVKGEDEEWRKAILAMLLAGRSHMFMDNVKGRLASPMLAAAITATHITERAMGGLGEVTVAVRCAWVATSNNAQLDSDTASRAVVIRLDTNLENPESRVYSHDPLEFIIHNRPQCAAAVITLVRLWQSQGSPRFKAVEQSRFHSWQSIIGGILETAGIPGFLENLKQFRDTLDPEKSAWTAFTQAWYENHGFQYVAAKDLIEIALNIPEVAAELGEKERATQTKRLGHQLKARRDKVFGDLKIHGGTRKGTGIQYRILPLNHPETEEITLF